MAGFSTQELFGTETRTSTLLSISMLGETHAGEIAQLLGRSRSRIKAAVDSLESAGIVVGSLEGSTKRLRLNPRYVAAEELEALLSKLALNDVSLQKRLSTVRRRPRRAQKSL